MKIVFEIPVYMRSGDTIAITVDDNVEVKRLIGSDGKPIPFRIEE